MSDKHPSLVGTYEAYWDTREPAVATAVKHKDGRLTFKNPPKKKATKKKASRTKKGKENPDLLAGARKFVRGLLPAKKAIAFQPPPGFPSHLEAAINAIADSLGASRSRAGDFIKRANDLAKSGSHSDVWPQFAIYLLKKSKFSLRNSAKSGLTIFKQPVVKTIDNIADIYKRGGDASDLEYEADAALQEADRIEKQGDGQQTGLAARAAMRIAVAGTPYNKRDTMAANAVDLSIEAAGKNSDKAARDYAAEITRLMKKASANPRKKKAKKKAGKKMPRRKNAGYHADSPDLYYAADFLEWAPGQPEFKKALKAYERNTDWYGAGAWDGVDALAGGMRKEYPGITNEEILEYFILYANDALPFEFVDGADTERMKSSAARTKMEADLKKKYRVLTKKEKEAAYQKEVEREGRFYPKKKNPPKKKATKKKAASPAKALISKCQKVWGHYCERPGRKRLKEVFAHLEKMEKSTAKTVKAELRRCKRSANAEAKRLGMKV